MLNSASWAELPITNTGLQWKEKTVPVGPAWTNSTSYVMVGHRDRADVSLKGYLPSFYEAQSKEVDSCSDIISGKPKSLTNTGDALSLEASFSYLELFQTATPSSPTFHSRLSCSCANKSVHGLCQLIPMCTCVQKPLFQLWCLISRADL